MGYIPAYDVVIAGLLAISLLVVLVARSIRLRPGLGHALFAPVVQFITREDIEISLAEEEADRAKLKAYSGEELVTNTSQSEAPPPTSGLDTETTPLLKSHAAGPAFAYKNKKQHTWRSASLAILGSLEMAGRTALLTYSATSAIWNRDVKQWVSHIVFLVAWIYATLKPIARPRRTVPYGILAVHSFSFLSSLGVFYALGLNLDDNQTPPSLVLHAINVFITFLGICIIMSMPIHSNGEPTVDEDGLLPAKDEFVTLFEWLTFNWMTKFVAIGAERTVQESDIWQLSSLLRARVVMSKFRHFKRKTLLRRILAANALDLFIDFVLTLVSATLSVAQPFLLNLLLRALEGSEFGVATESLPLRSIAFALPDAFFTIPAHAIATINDAIGFRPTSAIFTTAMLPGDNRQMAYVYATISFLCQLVKAQTDLQHLYYSRRASARTQSELIGSIYEKTLVRKDITGTIASDVKKTIGKAGDKKAEETSGEAVASADVGKIVSLISTDASQCSTVATILTRVYEIPVYFVGSCYLLYSLMGWTAFIGYLAFIVALPLNWVLMNATWKLRKTLLNVRDKRMREMNQVIHAIKFIKFFAWESKWVDRVMEARKREMQWLRKSKWIQFAMTFFWDVIPLLVTVVSFVAFVTIAKGELTVAIAFPALSGFALLTQSLTMVPMITSFLIQTYASIVRIEKYLEEEEVPQWVSWQSESRLHGSNNPADPFDERVGFVDASFAWTPPNKEADDISKNRKPAVAKSSLMARIRGVFKKASTAADAEAPAGTVEESEDDTPFELRDVNIWFKLGAINLVAGPTGSGKSSLLSALLGEMNSTGGEVYLPKSPLHVDPETGLRSDVSFCAQLPWLQHQSIRDNILFGLTFDEKRYKETLRVCQLTVDLDLLEDGDMTEIGEKGVSLSGGQKARVALARAVYSRSRTVLLDDVLSAVDSHTAEKLIKECLTGSLMKNRTVILVTHHIDLVIPHSAWVVQLDEGAVAAQGTPEELRKQGLLAAIRETAAEAEIDVEPIGDQTAELEDKALAGPKEKLARKLVDKEEKAEGRVKLSIYKVYLKAASYSLMGIAVALVLVHYVGEVAQKFWIRFWGEAYATEGGIALGFPRPQDDVWPYLGGYIALQVITAVITILSQLPSIYGALRASRELYRTMLLSVIRAPSRWFDKTPSGRILNRFSKDIDTVDSGLQSYVLVVIETAIASLATTATILWGTPTFIFPLIIIACLQVYISNGYVSFSRDMRRIESNTRSPIIASFSELINGISTVRAFGTERFFVDKAYKRLDRVQAANYYYWMGNRFLLYRLDSMGAFVVLFASIISIATGISSGLAGIVISSSSGLIMNLYWLLRYYTEMEQSMNSVERINDYMDVPSEPPAIIEDSRPPAYWPSSNGGVHVENLVVKYAPDLEPVLHGISFDIRPTEKIGLVGRTGSGKSTLALSFFRFVDPEQGKIVIDGVDITSIGLQDLRSRLAIIPQDAVLFSGSIRDNLDPFDEHSDEDCLDALRRVQLRTSASPGSTANHSRQSSRPASPHDNSPAGSADESSSTIAGSDRGKAIITLDSQVSESGNNFSAGQRQLIAMARALLRRSGLVVMDESTASVDFATDLKIQEAIREEFKDSILITIAHRLRTVIDYDRILVLDAGNVAEFDTPKNLIAEEDGIFHAMCVKSGDFEELKEAAERRTAW